MARRGRPEHEPTDVTRATVKSLAAFGIPQDAIGRQIGVSENTLRKHYERELDMGLHEANAKMAQTLYKKGLEGDTACMIFWLKTRARWNETQQVQHLGADGKPIRVPTLQDFYEMVAHGQADGEGEE